MANAIARFLIASCAIFCAAPAQSQGEPTLDCGFGPVAKTYGATPWLVYSCSDEHSVVIVTQEGNPAGPFYFMFHWEHGGYRLIGEGTGNKRASDLAFSELKTLTAADIQSLLEQTRAATPGAAAP